MKKLKLMIGLGTAGLVCLMMSGCQRQIFGVDEDVWNHLNEEERRQVIEGYNQEKLEKEKNAVIHESAKTAREMLWLHKK